MSSLVIRSAQPSDADAVSALTRRAYSPWMALTGREPLPMQVDYRQAILAHHFALAELNGELIGLIETTSADDAMLIINVAVEPTRQGSGVGQQLMAYAEALARSQGLRRTRLYTNKLFARNLRLYALLGYQIDREEGLNGGIAVHMSKSLAVG